MGQIQDFPKGQGGGVSTCTGGKASIPWPGVLDSGDKFSQICPQF